MYAVDDPAAADPGAAPGTLADVEAGILEEAPTWPDIAEAVRWGRARTPRVVVIEPDGAALWAGEGDPPAAVPRRWTSP